MGCTPSQHSSLSGVNYNQASDPSVCDSCVSSGQIVDHREDNVVRPSTTAGPEPESLYRRLKGNLFLTESNKGQQSHDQGAEKHVQLGTMLVQQRTMTVQLVFAKEGRQLEAFSWAANKGGYECFTAQTHDSAIKTYLEKRPDVIIIDARCTKYFDAKVICRSIRATKASEHTVLVALTKKYSMDKDEPSVIPLLTAGFNKRIIETSSHTACMNELLMLEVNDIHTQLQLSAADALLTAVDHSANAVEITSEDHIVQYVNPAYERIFGYVREELIGKEEKSMPELHESTTLHLLKGRKWEGTVSCRRKGGDNISHYCQIVPITGQNGKIRHLVSLKTPLGLQSSDKTTTANGTLKSCNRKESIARLHTMCMEAPITRVIALINTSLEDSPPGIAQNLERVLEILRSSELYSPYFNNPMIKGDQMTTDLVGGLITMPKVVRRISNDIHYVKTGSIHNSTSPSGSVLAQTNPEISRLLESALTWEFDVIKLEKVTSQRPLVYLGLRILQSFGALEFLEISETMMVNWLTTLEANYHSDNPYHNSTHAADVMHATSYFLNCEPCKSIFDDLESIAAILAAIIHDLDHPGKTNSFLVNAGFPLAVLYNDLAVLESHHVSLTFQIMKNHPDLNILKNLEREDYMAMRQTMVDMVLATEMTRHFEHLNKFVGVIVNHKEEQPSSPVDGTCSPGGLSMISLTHYRIPENRMLIKRMMIKCADVSNPVRPLEICKEWAKRIAEEYCAQTEAEKEQGLPVVMPVFDRLTCNVPKSQTSFIDFFINSMYDSWNMFCGVPELMSHLQTNYDYWKSREEDEAVVIAERLKKGAKTSSTVQKQKK